MKSNLIKIIFIFFIFVFINACHTFEHQNIFLDNVKKNLNQELLNIENKNSKIINDKTKISEMAPIDLPKQKDKVQKLTLQKKVKIPNLNNFDLDLIGQIFINKISQNTSLTYLRLKYSF